MTACSIDGCEKASRARGWCQMHYRRWSLHGDPNVATKRKLINRRIRNGGYIQVRQPEHPLANPDGWVWEHRVVLLASIGPGTHPCHWCGKDVSWDYSVGPDNGRALVVDHLDEQRANNVLSNLVPSCVVCNLHRSRKPQPVMTHCRRGHAFTPDNVYMQRGARVCRCCMNARKRREYWAQKEKAA